eukprot:2411033-Amphidinium_carterae.1
MTACEMMKGNGVVVTDCKRAALVTNKLKAGARINHVDGTPESRDVFLSLLVDEESPHTTAGSRS